MKESKKELPIEPGLFFMTVYHDDDCDHFKGKACSCDPDVVMEKWKPESDEGEGK